MTADLQELFDRAGRHEPTPVLDADAVLTLARRTRTRRRATTFAAVAGVALVAVGAAVVVGSTRRAAISVDPLVSPTSTVTPTASPTADPSDLFTPGPILIAGPTSSDGPPCSMRVVDPVAGSATPVTLSPPVSCATAYVWDRRGRAVAGVVDTKLWVWPTGAGAGTDLGDCSRCVGLTWSADSRSVFVVRTDTGELVTYDVTSGTSRAVALPLGSGTVVDAATSRGGSWVAVSVGSCPAGSSCPGTDGARDLAWRIDLITVGTGVRSTVVAASGPGVMPMDLRWSPDGTALAYVELDMHRRDVTGVRVRSIDMFGETVTTLHDSGATCYCIGAAPSLAWAPDGSALVASIPDGKLDANWALYTVSAGGADWHRVPGFGSGTVGWRAAG